ncbi:hypothetical protein GOBAR_AA09084 [Gossypium barbadense]|uniref:Uncharacterized protein n=2 Tax=Gossypium TaxID=3633 RepID=A0A2P5Y7J2_GOSBA|nr:hypothetical protein GOBAR_AA09084 [Gossypium barbadense]
MGSRVQSHKLSNGLLVSGRPEQLKERQPTMPSRAVPYTGGDVKKSGELGKMFDIPVFDRSSSSGPPSHPNSNPNSKQHSQVLQPSRASSSSQPNSGSVRSGSNSGPIRKSSGSMPLQPTGLITSGPLSSGLRRSGQLGQVEKMSAVSGKAGYGSAVTSLGEGVRKGLLGHMRRYPDAELRGAVDGQYVKVTGELHFVQMTMPSRGDMLVFLFDFKDEREVDAIQVVTCGSIPLESSYQRVPRCVYVSTELYEYRGWGGKSANPKHRYFSWGCRHSEKYVADFYISDFQSGLRALVKAGYGAKVAPFVKPATAVDITKENRDLSPSFLSWLAERNLSSDDRIMRLKEGYIKEGSTVSVMGVVRRHDNLLMIAPPSEPISIGCQGSRCLLPTYVEGLILTCDENQNAEVVPV